MEEIEKREEKLNLFFKDKYNIALVALACFVIISRLYYFFLLKNQPIWWDEADYLSVAKILAYNLPKPEWFAGLSGMRPLLLPLLWTAMFKIGFNELMLRFFTILLPGIGAILIIYLLGKDLYSKKEGLVAAFMFSCYWVWLFYTFRLLTDVPAVFLGLLSLYFFWTIYIKKSKPYGLYMCFLFGVLAFSTRFPLALVPIACVIFLLFVKKLEFFKDKTIWKGFAWGLIFLLPYLLSFLISKFSALQFYFGEESVSVHQPTAWYLFVDIFKWINSFWAIFAIIGLFSMWPLIISFDLVWKQKNTRFNSDLFVIIGLLVHMIFYVFIFHDGNNRWLLMAMPFLFFIAARGVTQIYNFIYKYSSLFAVIFVGILLIGGAYQNLYNANLLIDIKKDSYKEVKLAGEWLKENTPKETKIVAASVVQNEYYSERDSYHFYSNRSQLVESHCMDKFGEVIHNESCQKMSLDLFEEKLRIIKPDYLVVSSLEPVFTPMWVYNYSTVKNLTLVKGYALGGKPTLGIYKLKND